MTGVDTSPAAVEFCHSKGLDAVFQIEPGQIPKGPYSLITSFDVLEHVRDDIGMLELFHDSLEPGGMLLVSVPACKFLWSEHDEALEHVRRHVVSELRAKLTMSEFEVIRITYAVSLVFFPNFLYLFDLGSGGEAPPAHEPIFRVLAVRHRHQEGPPLHGRSGCGPAGPGRARRHRRRPCQRD